MSGLMPLPLLLLLLLLSIDHSPVAAASIDAKVVLERAAAGTSAIGVLKARHLGSLTANAAAASPSRDRLFPYSRHLLQQHRSKKEKSSGAALRSPAAGLGHSFGEYYITVELGSPGQEATLILDTGSELSWIQCLPCKSCAPSPDPIFDAAGSASYKPVTCGDDHLCSNSSQGTYAYCSSDDNDDRCRFAAFYGDGSFSYGVMSTETLIIDGGAVESFAFGCAELDLELVPTGSAGILGLNAGKMALPAQLGEKLGWWKFSHCFPDRSLHLNSTGVIFFFGGGDADPDPDLPREQIRYTSIVAAAAGFQQRMFYHVSLKAVKIISSGSEEMVSIPQSNKFILDSGSSFTTLSTPIHRRLRDAFLRQRPGILELIPGREFAGLDTCFRVSSDGDGDGGLDELHRTLPSLWLVFEDGAEIELQSVGVLLPVARYPDHVEVCFAFEDGGMEDVNIIGNYQQQNLWMEYDLERSRVGFARANCAID